MGGCTVLVAASRWSWLRKELVARRIRRNKLSRWAVVTAELSLIRSPAVTPCAATTKTRTACLSKKTDADVLIGYDIDSAKKLADDLGVTQARVSQIRSEALTSLRAHFGTLYDSVPEVDDESPGKRARAAYVAQLANQSTWRSRMDASEDSPTIAARMGA